MDANTEVIELTIAQLIGTESGALLSLTAPDDAEPHYLAPRRP